MAYTKTIWSTGDTITASLANKWETQWEESKASYESGEWSPPSNVETPQGAQAKADEAEQNANAYTESYAEPKFTKNTAFNKDFGTSAGTVAEGNHTHSGSDITSQVSSASQADNANNADTLDGKHASDFVYANKIEGNFHYTDQIDGQTSLIKRIPLGGSYREGKIFLAKENTGNPGNIGAAGILVFFNTNNLKTKVIGHFNLGSYDYVSVWTREQLGAVTFAADSNINGPGVDVIGYLEIQIKELYIDGTDLYIEFFNTNASGGGRLSAIGYWEVW